MTDQHATIVGHVHALYRYPVKSMRGESLLETPVTLQGLPADRRYAFVQRDNRSEFPYLTARQIPDMLLYTPYLVDPDHPDQSAIMVRTPEGEEYEARSAELQASLAARYPHPFYALRLGLTGTYDIAPLSLISTNSVAALGRAVGQDLPPVQFRPTIVIAPLSDDPFQEDQWVGRTLIFGDDAFQMHVSQRDKRCKMITLNPATGDANPQVLAEVVKTREECAGVYGYPKRAGILQVGQAVRLL